MRSFSGTVSHDFRHFAGLDLLSRRLLLQMQSIHVEQERCEEHYGLQEVAGNLSESNCEDIKIVTG